MVLGWCSGLLVHADISTEILQQFSIAMPSNLDGLGAKVSAHNILEIKRKSVQHQWFQSTTDE